MRNGNRRRFVQFTYKKITNRIRKRKKIGKVDFTMLLKLMIYMYLFSHLYQSKIHGGYSGRAPRYVGSLTRTVGYLLKVVEG